MNGCGPSWAPAWMIWLLFNWFFEAGCNRHDEGYSNGGNEIRRFECDWKFWLAMKRDVKRLAKWKRPLAWLVAISFYALVRAFGWTRFNYVEVK